MNTYLVILACVVSGVIPLACVLGWFNIRDKRMVKAQEAYKARRMKQAEEGHMDILDRAQWIQELHTHARRNPGVFREEGEK